jgi:hypothetical protein
VQIDDKVGAATLTGLAGQLTLTSSTGSINATGLTRPADVPLNSLILSLSITPRPVGWVPGASA